MREIVYNRAKAVAYAHKWAYARNPRYANFDKMGGDCTNFMSQCLFAGCGVMNFGGQPGWYFINLNRRTPSWSGVEFLYDFLTDNRTAGPYARETEVRDVMPGDIVQLKFSAHTFGHSLMVVECGSPAAIENIKIATHTFNSDNRPLTTYSWSDIRFLHIAGARKP